MIGTNFTGICIRGVVIAGIVLLLMSSGTFEKFEGWGFNVQLAVRGPIQPQSPIIIISIDEDSFDELQFQWPWPRSLHAQFLHTLRQGNPLIIGFDVLFTEPSQLGPEDDEALGTAIRQAENVVLAAALSHVDRGFYRKDNLNLPIPLIRKGALGAGPVNLPLDGDAYVRRARPYFVHQKTSLLSFDALIFERVKKASTMKHAIPAEDFYINFRGGPQTFETIPFYRVVNGEIPPAHFKDHIVLIGATSPLLHDVYATPFATSGTMPGVELHANVLETLLQDIPIKRIDRLTLALFTLAAGIAGMWLATRLSPVLALFVIGGTICAVPFVNFIGLTYAHLWTDGVPIPATLFLSYATATVESYIKERREKQRLSQYFSPSVLTDILRHPAPQRLQCQRRVVTVLFSDIRNFSAISEQFTPEATAAFLRDYFTEMTEVVFQHGGMVDKYMGDAIMALFNVPFDQPNHAGQAVRAALELQKRVATLSQQLLARHGQKLTCGIGIHTGEAIVGTIGSKQRFEYTAVGEAINLGARLESLSKELPATVILSEATYLLIQDQFPTRDLGFVSIKGKEEPVRIYTVESSS